MKQAIVNGATGFIGSALVRQLVADGVEVSIEPGRAGLTPEQVRQLVRGIMAAYAQVQAGNGAVNGGEGERGAE